MTPNAALSARSGNDACHNYVLSAGLNDIQRQRCKDIFKGEDYKATGNIIYRSSGSTDLKPETSRTRTIGIVLTPPVANLAITADFFDIRINGTVRTIGGNRMTSECLAADDYPNSRYCEGVVRNPGTGVLDELIDYYLNAGDSVTRGFDFTFRASSERGKLGKVGIGGDATLNIKQSSAIFEGDDPIESIGYVGNPKLLANAYIWYSPAEGTTIMLSGRFVGRQSNRDY